MKILITTGIYPPDSGGPATYSKLLFDELPARGVEVDVLSFGDVRSHPKLIRHFLYFLKILFRSGNFDLIYAQDPVSVGLPSVLAAKILRKKIILKIVGDYAWEQQQILATEFITPEDFQTRKFNFLTEIRRNVERWVAKSCDEIIVPSEYLKRIVGFWGVDLNKIFVIYNTFAFTNVNETKEEIRQALGIEKQTVLSAGRLVPWKGFEVLIEIMKDFPDEMLLIVGDGPDKEKLQNKISSLKLEDRVRLLGRLERNTLLKYLKASDLFVLNTGYEGFSHQLLEAMNSGIPVVATKVGGNTELIEDKKDGLLVNYNDKEEIKKAIISLLEDPNLKETLTCNAFGKIKQFNKQRLLDETLILLKSVLN